MKKINKNFSAPEWNQVFPNLDESFNDPLFNRDIGKAVKVLTAVFLLKRWDGQANSAGSDESKDYEEDVLFRAGRWRVRNGGIDCDETSYFIERVRLNDDDWVAQLSEKSWLYDPTDLLDSFEQAYKLFFPKESDEERENRLNRQIQNALGRVQFPFNTSNNLKRYIYLPSRMNEKKRLAFCEFLSDSELHPTF